VQKTVIPNPAEAFGENVLEDQPEKVLPFQGAGAGLSRFEGMLLYCLKHFVMGGAGGRV